MKRIFALFLAIAFLAGPINSSYAQDKSCKKECCKKCDPQCKSKCPKDECKKSCDAQKQCSQTAKS